MFLFYTSHQRVNKCTIKWIGQEYFYTVWSFAQSWTVTLLSCKKHLRQIETSLFQFATSLCAPGTNQMAGFSGYRPLTIKEINKLKLLLSPKMFTYLPSKHSTDDSRQKMLPPNTLFRPLSNLSSVMSFWSRGTQPEIVELCISLLITRLIWCKERRQTSTNSPSLSFWRRPFSKS